LGHGVLGFPLFLAKQIPPESASQGCAARHYDSTAQQPQKGPTGFGTNPLDLTIYLSGMTVSGTIILLGDLIPKPVDLLSRLAKRLPIAHEIEKARFP